MPNDKLDFIRADMAALRESNLLITLRTMGSPADAWMVVDGRRVLNFCTNNYLGLANHPRLKDAAVKAVEQWGVGPAAVRSIAGTQALHVELERRLAEFKHVEDALYLQSGFVANQAAIGPLVGKEDVIFSDRLNHASIIDGARLSGAKIIVYEHCDVADAEAKIREHLPNYRRGLLITDGVFSMDGDIAPLDRLSEVAERYGVLTMVDDAHGEGVLGHGGRGIVDHFGLHGVFDLEIGTLSKAFGVVGGVIAGKKAIVDYIRQKARPFLFSSASHPCRHGGLPRGRGPAGGIGGAGGAAVGERTLLQGRNAAAGVRHGPVGDADCTGDAGRRWVSEGVQPPPVRRGRLRDGARLPHRAARAGPHPRDEHRRALAGRPRSGAGRVCAGWPRPGSHPIGTVRDHNCHSWYIDAV